MNHFQGFRKFTESKNYPAVTREGVDAVAYLTGDKCAMGFSGKRDKPDFHYTFGSTEKRDKYAQEYLSGIEANQQAKAQRLAEKKAWKHDLKVGDILESSWGYDQTNREYWQVVSASEKSIVIREIAQKSVEGTQGFMCENVLPVPDNFIGEPTMKIPQRGYNGTAMVRVHECATADKWEGKPGYRSWYA